jgi:hypothetical protein
MAQLLTCAAQGNEHYTGETPASGNAVRPDTDHAVWRGLDRVFTDLAINLIFFLAVHSVFFKHFSQACY